MKKLNCDWLCISCEEQTAGDAFKAVSAMKMLSSHCWVQLFFKNNIYSACFCIKLQELSVIFPFQCDICVEMFSALSAIDSNGYCFYSELFC